MCAKVGDFYPKAWDRQTKGEGNSLSLYLQTLLLVVRKFFIGSREVFYWELRWEESYFVSLHIYEEGELDKEATCRKFRQVRQEGERMVNREIPFYHCNPL